MIGQEEQVAENKRMVLLGRRVINRLNPDTAEDVPVEVTPAGELKIRTRQPETSGEIITQGRLTNSSVDIFTAEPGSLYRNVSIRFNNNTGSDSNLTYYIRKRGATKDADSAWETAKTLGGNKTIGVGGFDLVGGDIISGLSSVSNAIHYAIIGDRVRT